MSNLVGTPPLLESVMGCHGNHAFSNSPNRFNFFYNFVHIKGSYLKKNVTHVNLSKSAR